MVQRLSATVLDSRDYDTLKASVLAFVEKSRPELFESILNGEILTGRPSTCLATLRRTAQKVGVGDDFVRHRFLQSLPSTIAPVLASQPTLTLDPVSYTHLTLPTIYSV